MPIFERPPLETLASAKDRWTPLYLEHGRLEVDDSSVKWIGANGLLCRLPVATVSALILDPGTTVTHAAIKACAESNTPVCWTGEESLRFYAFGLTPNHTNDMPRLHAEAWADKRRRTQIARAMFRMRFPEMSVDDKSIKELRGMEGLRVRALYAQFGLQHGVTWKGRNYDRQNWDVADDINRALSAANASLYALCAAVISSLGYLPSLGFVHDAGTLPFVYDVADLYKHLTSIPAAFLAVRQNPGDEGELVRKLLKQRIEEERILQRLPKDLAALFQTDEAAPEQAGAPSALRLGMTVIIAQDTPPAIRGLLKRWFVEPKPNVFVGTVNRRTRDKVLDYVKRNASGLSLLILTTEPNCQGFKIERWGEPDRRDTELSGLWLVAEQWVGDDKQPF